jgi:hypothetical protein
MYYPKDNMKKYCGSVHSVVVMGEYGLGIYNEYKDTQPYRAMELLKVDNKWIGDGMFVQYSPVGKISMFGKMKNGKMDDQWIKFHSKTNVCVLAYIYKDGVQHGKQYVFNNRGKLIRIVDVNHGVPNFKHIEDKKLPPMCEISTVHIITQKKTDDVLHNAGRISPTVPLQVIYNE